MHLLCTILGLDSSNNHSTLLYFHDHYLQFTWPDTSIKLVCRYVQVSYIVFPISLAYMNQHCYIYKVLLPTWLKPIKNRNSYESLLCLLAKYPLQPPLDLESIIHIP